MVVADFIAKKRFLAIFPLKFPLKSKKVTDSGSSGRKTSGTSLDHILGVISTTLVGGTHKSRLLGGFLAPGKLLRTRKLIKSVLAKKNQPKVILGFASLCTQGFDPYPPIFICLALMVLSQGKNH